jgi:hypothetical protein
MKGTARAAPRSGSPVPVARRARVALGAERGSRWGEAGRASTGYGKRWLHLGDVQWGRTMQQDLSDAVLARTRPRTRAWQSLGRAVRAERGRAARGQAAWAAREGFADPARTAIMGGSYGGYATLAGLAFTPEVRGARRAARGARRSVRVARGTRGADGAVGGGQVFCCGVDIVGPAHLRTLLESVPAYWAPMKKMLALRVGDVEESPGPRHGAARAQAALEAAAAARALTWGG